MNAPIVARTRAELERACNLPVALVPTMGALHAGHAALIDAARTESPRGERLVVASVFVNPLQFGPGEDLDRYPWAFDSDVALCGEHGVDVVFAPSVEEIYPHPARVRIDPGELGDQLEGAARPGHFAGVLTVVHKLLHIVPGVASAYFGEKDFQQWELIRRMVDDLDLRTIVRPVPIVRAEDGLALSSRNVYLGPADRRRAPVLVNALRAGARAGASGADAVLAAAAAVLAGEPALSVDYLQLSGADLQAAPERGAARLLVAARLGGVRLLDNIAVQVASG